MYMEIQTRLLFMESFTHKIFFSSWILGLLSYLISYLDSNVGMNSDIEYRILIL